MKDQVILVDNQDRPVGIMPKLEVHQKGLLHRAFSVFVFNSNGELLMQQRASNKYHSSGLWSNTCCSHPYPGELVGVAAARRLKEEMGIKCLLQPVFNFIYYSDLDSGLIENEFDHVFFGYSDDVPAINRSEVSDYKYVDMNELAADIIQAPGKYTAWLKKCVHDVVHHYTKAVAEIDLNKQI